MGLNLRFVIVNAFLYLLLLFISLLLVHTSASYLIPDIGRHPLGHYLWMIGVYGVAFLLMGLYTRRMSGTVETLQGLKATALAMIGVGVGLFLSKEGESYSRLIVLGYFLLTLSIPFLILPIRRRLMRLPWMQEKVLLIADDEGVERVRRWLEEEPGYGWRVAESRKPGEIDTLPHSRFLPVAIVALESEALERTLEIVETLQHRVDRILLLPRRTRLPLMQAEFAGAPGRSGIAFGIRNRLFDPLDRGIKNGSDLVLGSLLTLALSPLLIGIALLIWMRDGHTPLYTQERVGRRGRPFRIYKFRTMRPDAEERLKALLESDPALREEWERERKLHDDPRITPIGKFLRRSSLDELPQLLNVLRSEMSLVGPRPIVADEARYYGKAFHYYTAVRPGITGLWQISGRNDLSYGERVELDSWYVRNWSLNLDMMILIRTAGVVWRREGSY